MKEWEFKEIAEECGCSVERNVGAMNIHYNAVCPRGTLGSWILMIYPDTVFLGRYKELHTCTLLFHDHEARTVLPLLGRCTVSPLDVIPLEFCRDKGDGTYVTIDAKLALAYHAYKEMHHDTPVFTHFAVRITYDDVDREMDRLAKMGKQVHLLIKRMRKCPTLRDVTDEECTRILMSGSIDVGELLDAALGFAMMPGRRTP